MTREQALVDAALRSWRSNMDRAGKFFGSLTSDELELEVAPSRNRLVYIWGHLASFSDAILPLFGSGPRRYPDLDKMFVSQPDRTVAEMFTGPELKNVWTKLDTLLWGGTPKAVVIGVAAAPSRCVAPGLRSGASPKQIRKLAGQDCPSGISRQVATRE